MADMAALGARIRQLFDERTKTLIADGPITITETAEGIVIGSDETSVAYDLASLITN